MKKLFVVAGIALALLAVTVVFAGSSSAQTVDLISLVDLNRDVVNGNWELVNGELIFDETPAARISFPYRPPLEYDYTVEFTLTHGSNPWGNIAQLVSHGDVPFTWSTNAGTGHYCRLEDINGHSIIGNPTLTPYEFVGGQRYTSIVRVRNDRVICEINGQILVEYETDYSDLSRNRKWEMPDQLNIGLGGWNGPNTIHSATVTVPPIADTYFTLTKVKVKFKDELIIDEFEVKGEFALGENSDGIEPVNEDVVLTVGTSNIVIPADSFIEKKPREYEFKGAINSTEVDMKIKEVDIAIFDFWVKAKGTDLTGTANPVNIKLLVGDDMGTTDIRLKGKLQFKQKRR